MNHRFRVIATDAYQTEKEKWSRAEIQETEKIEKKLASNPNVGDACRYKFLREKRIGGKRIYFLVYKKLRLVILVATSGKKDQQETIDHLIEELEQYKVLAEDIAKQLASNDLS